MEFKEKELLTYEERRKQIEDDAEFAGLDLNYKPEVAVEDIEAMTNEEWLISRQKGIGGSDAGAIMGVNKYTPAAKIAYDKLAANPVREVTPEQQYTLDFGHVMEAPILALYAAKTGYKVWTDRHQYRHPLYPFMLADCDGYARTPEGENIGLEIKTYNYTLKGEWQSGVYGVDGRVKNPEYVYQVTHYMAVLNLSRIDLIAMCGNNPDDMIVVRFYRDILREDSLIKAEKKFWEDVQKGIIPATTTLRDEALENLVKVAYEDRGEPAKDLSDVKDRIEGLLEISDRKKALKAQLKELEERENGLQADVITVLDGSDTGRVTIDNTNYIVTFKPKSLPDKVNAEMLKLDYPEIYRIVAEQNRESDKCTFSLKKEAVKKKK